MKKTPPDLQQHKKIADTPTEVGYYNPNKKKKLHYKSQGRNTRLVSNTHTKEGKLKY